MLTTHKLLMCLFRQSKEVNRLSPDQAPSLSVTLSPLAQIRFLLDGKLEM